MSRNRKILFVIIPLLILFGASVALISLRSVDFDFKKLSVITYEKKEYIFDDLPDTVNISAGRYSIKFGKSNDGKCHIITDESNRSSFEVTLENGELKINHKTSTGFIDELLDVGRQHNVTVLLDPEHGYRLWANTESGDMEFDDKIILYAASLTAKSGDVRVSCRADTLNISTSSGKVTISDKSFTSVAITTKSGSVDIDNASCVDLSVISGSGNITMTDTLATDKITVGAKSGSVELNACEALQFDISTSSGSITASLLHGKVYDIISSSGNIEHPENDISGGIFRARSGSGNIKITSAK